MEIDPAVSQMFVSAILIGAILTLVIVVAIIIADFAWRYFE